MSLEVLSILGTRVSDLTPLTGMPLDELELIRTSVTDLTPLRGMPLRRLGIEETAISDLSPPQGMALHEFWMGTTQVADLSPLKGMPIRLLHIDDCPRLTDLSPLLAVPALEELFLPKTATNVELLRALPNLKFISYDFDRRADHPLHSSDEFWSMIAPMNEEMLARNGKFAELERVIRSRLESHRSREVWKDYIKLATVALAMSNHLGYRELCAQIERLPPGIDAETIIKIGCWSVEPGISQEQMRKSLSALKAAYGESPVSDGWRLFDYALCEYRLGLWEQASKRLLRAPRFDDTRAIVHTLLALTHCRQGNFDSARAEMEQARPLIELGWPAKKSPAEATHIGAWYNCLLARLLLEEAEKLLGSSAARIGSAVPSPTPEGL